MTSEDFEARYRGDPDPWGYETSAYEAAKYAATLAACGPGPFADALELGSSIGVLSARLASRCERLVTLDAAPTAVDIARRRLNGTPGVEVRLGTIPDELPATEHGHDLVLASEILYYLSAPALDATLETLERTTRPGARLVAVHWRPPGPERPFSATEVHANLKDLAWLKPVDEASTDDYLLDWFTRR